MKGIGMRLVIVDAVCDVRYRVFVLGHLPVKGDDSCFCPRLFLSSRYKRDDFMDAVELLAEYKSYLLLERRMSANTIEAYMRDVNAFGDYMTQNNGVFDPSKVAYEDIERFIFSLSESGAGSRSVARTISGVKSFFSWLYLYDKIETLPTELVETPKIGRKIPDYLTENEVERMIASVDLSYEEGHRNRAILEVMYSCGLRVSEVVTLRISDLFFDDGYLRVVGKGDKERLVPVSAELIKQIGFYRQKRARMRIESRYADFLFLNRRGGPLSRVMVFNIVKQAAFSAGIAKTVSPHTFRHTFATQLVKGGADIRLVQQMLGHSSILTTEVYTHLDTRHKQETIEAYHPLNK